MFQNKPIIGIVGGIGSGKSTVARALGELGCLVIDADLQVRQAYEDPGIRSKLRVFLGEALIPITGPVDRKGIAGIVFKNREMLSRLEQVLHPWVAEDREKQMKQAIAANPRLPAIVWDIPLLCETGLHAQCDAVVFVECDLPTRLKRVQQRNGWDQAKLTARENLQWPLAKKKEIAQYIVSNTADAEICSQVREVLSRVLAKN